MSHATALHEANLLIKDAFDLVAEWQSAKPAKRKQLLKELQAELPDLTLED